MSSGGSNLEPTGPGDEVQSLKLATAGSSEASSEDGDVYSIQTSDMFDRPLSARAERLVTHHQITFDPVTIRRELAKAIILHDYPLSIINDRGFKELFFAVFPSISQSTLKSEILKIYEFEKIRSMELFEDIDSKIAITTHTWVSSDQTKSFVAITGHMIYDDWKVRPRMMRFVNVPHLSTPELLAKIMVECFLDWEVETKLSTVAIENSSSDRMLSDVLIDKLSSTSLLLGGKLLRTECFAHVVSLMVQDAFAVVSNVIEKIRDGILFWNATPQREREFKEVSRDLGISVSNNNLMHDSVSKWNTTFLMLQTALLYKTVFSHLRKSESQFSCMPSEEEWGLLEEICQKLKLFYDAMKHVSKYSTANFGLPQFCEIKITLSRWITCDNMQVREMALAMLEKFDKYWLAVRDIFAVASVLDPRFKLQIVEFCFPKIYGEAAQIEIEHIRQICYDLFNEYQANLDLEKANRDNSSSSSMQDSDNYKPWQKMERLYKKYLRDERKRKKEEPKKHELDAYLESQRIPVGRSVGNFDILSWWKETSEYPTLKKMARDILAIPICSVPPENIFDVGGSVLSPHRTRLHPNMVEMLMCAQSCLWTSIKGSYSITNSYSWGTSYDYDAVEDHAAEGDKSVKS